MLRKLLPPQIPDFAPGMEAFKKTPKYIGLRLMAEIAPILLFLPWMIVVFRLSYNSPLGMKGPMTWLLLGLFFPVLLLFLGATRLPYLYLTKMRDRSVLGPPMPEEIYVGVSYSHGNWSYKGESSWDRGYLTIEQHCLKFRGFGPEFSFSPSLIRNIRIDSSERVAWNTTSRIYLEWSSVGTVNTVCFETRGPLSRSSIEAATQSLYEKLKSVTESDQFSLMQEIEPFPSSALGFNTAPEIQLVSTGDRVIAFVISISAYLVFTLGRFYVEDYFHFKGSSPTGMLICLFSVSIYNRVVLHRVTYRTQQLNLA